VYEPSADTGKLWLVAVPLNTAVTSDPSELVQVFSWRPLGTAVGAAIEPVSLEDPYTLISLMLHQKPDAAVQTMRMYRAVWAGSVTDIFPMLPLSFAIAPPQSAPSSETYIWYLVT
jgi:hypothetical protein